MNTTQQSLFGEVTEELKGDNRQTPNEIASLMAKLVKPTDRYILCPAAGTGQIVKFLPQERMIICCEINSDRANTGKINTERTCVWINNDFFNIDFRNRFDLIIENPPFSRGLDFLERSLELLNRDNPESRICFLLPGDYFYGKQRRLKLQSLNCHIHHIYPTGLGDGRIAYLDACGKPEKGRQVYDVVFDIRLGKKRSAITYLTDL
jgi:hypothetical protein